MGIEIERKYLLASDIWRDEVTEVFLLRQGYLSTTPECTVRVRINGTSAFLAIKGKNVGGSALEFEFPLPLAEATQILDTLAKKPLIEKKRHLIPRDGLVWEVDEFLGRNAGLVLAEVELASPEQVVPLPSWLGREVTGDSRYYNANLVGYPFVDWNDGIALSSFVL